MNVAKRLNKPEYIFRPTQVIRRMRSRSHGVVTARLAWGDEITVDGSQMIGATVLRQGVYDLAVTEVLCRLTDPGETALDIGAHLGVMTSLFAHRVGPEGAVFAFEPNPETYRHLASNAVRWGPHVHPENVGLSDHAGQATLHLPAAHHHNDSMASFIETEGSQSVSVRVVRLDDIAPDAQIAKIDVEGAEPAVLRGAQRILANLRDFVFEGSATGEIGGELRSRGFAVFAIEKHFRGVVLKTEHRRTSYEPLNGLATRDPERARDRFMKRGWQSLHR